MLNGTQETLKLSAIAENSNEKHHNASVVATAGYRNKFRMSSSGSEDSKEKSLKGAKKSYKYPRVPFQKILIRRKGSMDYSIHENAKDRFRDKKIDSDPEHESTYL